MSARTAFGPSLSASALCASKQKLRFRDALQLGAGTMAEPCALEGEDRKQGHNRMGVAETTVAILGSMSKKPKKAPTELEEQPPLVKKRKKKKLKRARRKVLEAAAAAKAEAKGGAGDGVGKKGHASGGKQPPPKISYRECKDHFMTHYNKLECKAFSFTPKKNSKNAARHLAEDLRRKSVPGKIHDPNFEVQTPESKFYDPNFDFQNFRESCTPNFEL